MLKKWTNEMVRAQLSEIIAGTGVMPSAGALREIGRNDLAIQVQRRGGFASWAAAMSSSSSPSDSATGWAGEIKLAEALAREGFEVKRMPEVKSPYDLVLDGCLRIDVKSSSYAEYGAVKGWFYRIGKRAQADVVALYQLDTGDCYFLPWASCSLTNMTISRTGGKYVGFKNNLSALRSLCAARKLEAKLWPEMQ